MPTISRNSPLRRVVDPDGHGDPLVVTSHLALHVHHRGLDGVVVSVDVDRPATRPRVAGRPGRVSHPGRTMTSESRSGGGTGRARGETPG